MLVQKYTHTCSTGQGLKMFECGDIKFISLTDYYFDRIRHKLTHSSEINCRRLWSDSSIAGVVSNITVIKRVHLSG